MTDEPSKREPAAEREDLRARLAEAEDLLRAIRDGEVDAVVVTGERGEQVFTLRGADRVYRQLIETMSEGAVALSANGVILYCNVRLSEMLGRPLDHVLGTELRSHLPTAGRQAFDAILAQARTGTSRREINLITGEGRLVPVYLSASPLHSEGTEIGFCLVLTDLTEQKRHEQTSVAERLARLILEQAAEAIVVCDEAGRVIRVSQTALRFCDDSPLLRPFAEAFPLRTVAPGPFHLGPVFQGETLRNVDVTLDRQGQILHLILNAGQILNGREILGCIVTLTNITERKRAEEEIKVLAKFPSENPDPVMRISTGGTLLFINESGSEQLSEWNLQIGKIAPPHLRGVVSRALNDGSRKLLDLKYGELVYSFSVLPVREAGYANLYGHNITKSKRAEEELKSSEKRFRDISEHAQKWIWEVDAEGKYTYSSQMVERILGYTPEEILQKHFFDSFHPEDRESHKAAALAGFAAKQPFRDFINRNVHKNGQIVWLSTSALPLLDEKGKLLGYRGVDTDITERKRTEWALQESEEKFRVIFEDSKDGIVQVDVDSRKFIAANKTFCDMMQYTLDEIRHLGIMDIHPQEDVPWIIEEFDRRARHETEKVLDIPVRRKDGSIFWADIKSSPVTISGNNFILGNFRDVTERRKAEETLARLGMAVDQSAETIIITDREGTIQYVNPAFERISGYSREEALGKNPRILRSGKQDESFYREMWSALARGEVWTGHFNNRKKDGSLYEEDATISPVRDSLGNVVSFVGVMRDVTQLLVLENQVRTAQKMEAVGTLAGGIAHDFNNALTGIFGFGDLLRMRMAGDGQASHDLDEIMRCAERAATLTRQLLTFARRQVIDPVNLTLNTLVADLMKLIGKVVGEHIEVIKSLEKNVPAIYADRGQIEQVVMNLCLNARDAMPEGGRLVVETADVTLDEEDVRRNPYMKTGRYALLTVSDTGIGMDEKTCEQVFEPFFTTKAPGKGTGLGLSMVYGIVKQHGGFINLYSEPGKGTAFKVYFPAIEAQPDAVPAVRREDVVLGGTETILLAEDDEGIRALAERILTGFGYTVLAARNGEEAVEMFRRHEGIVLAVLDVVMPRMGGKEAFEEMRMQNPRLKVIFMSGYSANAIHDSFVLIPGTPFVQKPFGPTILARKVREVLDLQ